MLDDEDIARYRRMSQEERLDVFRRLMNFAWDSLLELSEEERRRRLELAEREHAEGNARLEERFRTLP
jgi:hypothetical protein